jgi:type I restriction-modification system DNA methylase subunit
MSDEGQYFTNRAICKLAFKKSYEIKKVLRRTDGSLCTFADWFCGTGGFPAEFVKGVKAHVPDVNWKTESGAVYCQDMNLSSVTTTLLNLLILTGIPFSDKTIRSANSFTDSITTGAGAPFAGLTVDYCFMNPPYGGDKTKGKEYKFAYSKTVKDEAGAKTKRFFVNQEIQSIGIEDDDKVSAGVQLSMATLSADGGVCAIVLPQGFFFGASKKCVELRKKIAEEYKIHYVVDIASGSFLNTGTKTSMMVFQKGVGATEKVAFIGLDEKPLVEATLEDLRAKHYSLNYKQYLPQSAVEVEGFEMVKLGDISKKLSTRGKHSAKDTIETGKYSLFSSSVNEIYKLATFDYSETCCIVNSTNASGNAVVNLGREFSVTSDTFVFKCDNDLTTKYLQLYLSNNLQLVKDQFQGANHKHPTWDRLASITIPLPSLERQAEIVEANDGWASLAQQEMVALKILEKQMMFQVKEMGRGQVRVKLGEVCEINHGKRVTKKDNLGTIYPVYGGGDDTFRTDNKNRDGFTCKVSRFGISLHNCVQTIYGDYWLMDSGFTVKSVSEKTTDAYIYYWLTQNKELVYQCGRATAQMNMDMDTFRNLELPLPPFTDQQTLQSDFDEIRHKHAKIAEYKAKAQAAIQRLIPGADHAEDASSTSTINEVITP